MRLNIGGPGSAQGADAFFQNQAQQQYKNFLIDQQRRKMVMEQTLFNQQQSAQNNAGNAIAGMLPQPPQPPAGAVPPPGVAPQGPLPPPPGQSSQPMAMPGQLPPPQMAMQGGMPQGGMQMQPQPQQPQRPPVPMMPVPQQIPPYRTMPQQQPQPQAAQQPMPGAGGLPPPPAAPAPQAAQPQPQQFTFDNVAQALTSQGLKGGELWRAMNEVAPRMDAQYRQQLQQMNQEIAMLRVQAGISAQQTRAQQGERRIDQADTKNQQGQERLNITRQQADNSALPPETLKAMAQQYLAGDSSVLQNLGRGAQGSKNIVELRKAITEESRAQNMSPKDTAAKLAEFQGFKAGQRTLGTRTANIEMAGTEADKLADLALQASGKVARTDVKSINAAMQAVQKGTASPELRAFTAANTSFINAYARAINPQGVGTVADKEHAREMLDTGFSKGDYQAVIAQLKKEIGAARASPGSVRTDMRQGFTGTLPEGIPAGSKVIGKSPEGKDVYQSPDGKKWTP